MVGPKIRSGLFPRYPAAVILLTDRSRAYRGQDIAPQTRWVATPLLCICHPFCRHQTADIAHVGRAMVRASIHSEQVRTLSCHCEFRALSSRHLVTARGLSSRCDVSVVLGSRTSRGLASRCVQIQLWAKQFLPLAATQ